MHKRERYRTRLTGWRLRNGKVHCGHHRQWQRKVYIGIRSRTASLGHGMKVCIIQFMKGTFTRGMGCDQAHGSGIELHVTGKDSAAYWAILTLGRASG